VAAPAAAPARDGAAPAAGPHTSREDVWVKATMRRMTVAQKVGQMMTGYVYGTDAHTPDARNTALYGVATPAEVVEEFALGGVVHFVWTDSYSKGPEQLARLNNGLQDAARSSNRRVPLMISTDQETGRPPPPSPARWRWARAATPRAPAVRPPSPGPSC
jgi:beta-N-acetylhexosaminidase